MNIFQNILFYLTPSQYFREVILGRVFGSKEHRRFLKLVPKECYYCELLGICRDKDNDWKCVGECLANEELHLK